MENWRCLSRDVAGNFLAALLEPGRSDRDVADSIQARGQNFSDRAAALFAFGGADWW